MSERDEEPKKHRGQEDLERNAEYQRRRVMTADERAFEARDRVAKAVHEQNMRDGKNTTWEQAERKGAEIAERAKRQRSENNG